MTPFDSVHLPGLVVPSLPSVPPDGLELVVPPRTGVVLLG
jgi:hypothetical protein